MLGMAIGDLHHLESQRQVSEGGVKIPEEYRALAKLARQQGWTITVCGSGHLRWTTPDGRAVFSPKSPGDGRGIYNVRAKLRRAGLDDTTTRKAA